MHYVFTRSVHYFSQHSRAQKAHHLRTQATFTKNCLAISVDIQTDGQTSKQIDILITKCIEKMPLNNLGFNRHFVLFFYVEAWIVVIAH